MIAHARVVLAAALLASSSACAYYNGVYNAKTELKAGDRLASTGRDAEASARYGEAAAKAESVLVRFPRTKWRPLALAIAGRGLALSGNCPAARGRLVEAAAAPLDARTRDLLVVAQGACDVREARPGAALAALEPLATRGHPDARASAALWAARAAIALGDAARARAVLGSLDAGAAQWELAQASLAAHQYAAAESLLTLRAARGDVRPDLTPMLRTLWLAGERQAVERLVGRYHGASTRAGEKLALHLLVADLQMDVGWDDAARAHLLAARRLSVDSVTDAEAAARRTLLALAPRRRGEEVAAAVRRGSASGRGAALQRRLDDSVLLLELLAGRPDNSGATLYLAAEVARDSLRAPRLAVQLFRRIDAQVQGAILAPRGLSAAAVLESDSAAPWHARMRDRYPRSPWTLALDGASPGELPAWEVAEATLRVAWNDVAVQFADSLKRLRTPVVPGANARATRAARKPAAKAPATGAIP
ncbi:MAG: hypothetical protein P3B98_07240 [Gemmatimonadota bacterium]|nr:hypothetical protein [Gemmatimonadota bacterium]